MKVPWHETSLGFEVWIERVLNLDWFYIYSPDGNRVFTTRDELVAINEAENRNAKLAVEHAKMESVRGEGEQLELIAPRADDLHERHHRKLARPGHEGP